MLKPDHYADALRDGLSGLTTPEVSSDFKSRVITQVDGPRSRWEALFYSLRPALSAMCCSLVVCLAVSYWVMHGPVTITFPVVSKVPMAQLSSAAVDKLLDGPNLSEVSLQQLSRLSASVNVAPPAPAHRPRDIRHACLPRKASLTC